MPRCRVVTPKTKRIPLSDDDWIDVVEELNAGEYSDLLTNMVARKPFSKVLAYLVAWSFVALDGSPLAFSLQMDEDARRATVRGLDKATYRELTKAIDAHETAEEAALDAKKKTKAEPTVSALISSSAGT